MQKVFCDALERVMEKGVGLSKTGALLVSNAMCGDSLVRRSAILHEVLRGVKVNDVDKMLVRDEIVVMEDIVQRHCEVCHKESERLIVCPVCEQLPQSPRYCSRKCMKEDYYCHLPTCVLRGRVDEGTIKYVARLLSKYWYGSEGSTLFTIQKDIRANIFKDDAMTSCAYYSAVERIVVFAMDMLLPPNLVEWNQLRRFYALSMHWARDLEQLYRVGLPYIAANSQCDDWDAEDIKRVFESDDDLRLHVGVTVSALMVRCADKDTRAYEASITYIYTMMVMYTCEYCNKWFDHELSMCGRCLDTTDNAPAHYCSVECQGKHWKESHRAYHQLPQ
jgi:hypothetical protein